MDYKTVNKDVVTSIFSRNFKKLIDRNETSQRALAAQLGVGEVAVSCWANGTRFPTEKYISAIADYFNVPIYSLFLREGEGETFDTSTSNTVELGSSLVTSFVNTSEKPDFAFIVTTDDMSPEFNKNDVIFCKSVSTAKNGDLVVTDINGRKTLRRVYYTAVSAIFSCSNPKYSPQQFFISNSVAPKIIGIPVAYQRSVAQKRA